MCWSSTRSEDYSFPYDFCRKSEGDVHPPLTKPYFRKPMARCSSRQTTRMALVNQRRVFNLCVQHPPLRRLGAGSPCDQKRWDWPRSLRVHYSTREKHSWGIIYKVISIWCDRRRKYAARDQKRRPRLNRMDPWRGKTLKTSNWPMDCDYQKFQQDHTPAVPTRGCGWMYYAWRFILSLEADVVAIF